MTKPHQCHGTSCVGWSYGATADSWTRSWSQAMHDYPRFELWSSACTRDGKFHGSQYHVCNRYWMAGSWTDQVHNVKQT